MQKKEKQNQKISLIDKVLFWSLNLKITNDKEFSMPYNECRDVYYFIDYASFLNFLSENGIDVDEHRSVVHSVIFRINKKGEVFVTKYLCDYLILKIYQLENNNEQEHFVMEYKKLSKKMK